MKKNTQQGVRNQLLRNAAPCRAVLRCAVRRCYEPCCTALFRAVRCRAMLCRAVSCRVVPCRAVPCCAVPCCPVLYLNCVPSNTWTAIVDNFSITGERSSISAIFFMNKTWKARKENLRTREARYQHPLQLLTHQSGHTLMLNTICSQCCVNPFL